MDPASFQQQLQQLGVGAPSHPALLAAAQGGQVPGTPMAGLWGLQPFAPCAALPGQLANPFMSLPGLAPAPQLNPAQVAAQVASLLASNGLQQGAPGRQAGAGGALQPAGPRSAAPSAEAEDPLPQGITRKYRHFTAGKSKSEENEIITTKEMKRILANRQSAAKSKERRLQHAKDLEEKVEAQEAEVAEVDEYVQKLIADNNTLRLYNQEASQLIGQLQLELQLLNQTSESMVCDLKRAQSARGEEHRLPEEELGMQPVHDLPAIPALMVPL